MNSQRFGFLKTKSENTQTLTLTAQEARDIHAALTEGDKAQQHLNMALRILSTCTPFGGQPEDLILKMIALESEKQTR